MTFVVFLTGSCIQKPFPCRDYFYVYIIDGKLILLVVSQNIPGVGADMSCTFDDTVDLSFPITFFQLISDPDHAGFILSYRDKITLKVGTVKKHT